MDVDKFIQFKDKVSNNIEKVIIGKDKKIEKVIAAFICGGHVLLEDVPGLGKTKLAKALSKSLDCSFKRVQFTPDLLPSDLTGIYFYNQKSCEFEFREGPILSQIILADEINRATPRTQSALLECMEERQVTIEGNTVRLKAPFFVIATQNPVEQYGTFPLPEAQMDRFFMKISLGYPEYSEEKNMLDRFMKRDPLEDLKPAVSIEDILYVQNNYSSVNVSDDIKNYILDIINETRKNRNIELGCSPRGTLSLMKGCQALAAIRGRDYVIPEDVKEIAVEVLSHRLILRNQSNQGISSEEKIIEDILNKVDTPLEKL